MGVGSCFLLPSSDFSKSNLAFRFLHRPFLLYCRSFCLKMASDRCRKGKKLVDGPIESPQDSQLGDSVDDSFSDPNVKVSSLSEADVVRLQGQYRISKQFRLSASNPSDQVYSSPLD